MSIILILLTAIGLSMDAFSLALIYGTLNMRSKMNNIMSITVGIFHFFMPILGYTIGQIILNIIRINPNVLVGIIFIILAIEMLISLKKEEQAKVLTNILSIILFAFTVSIDSFSVGIAYGALKNNIVLAGIIFSIVSALFTYGGVNMGKRLVNKYGNIANIIGSIILLILGISYLIK